MQKYTRYSEPIGQYASDHVVHVGQPGLDQDHLGVKTRGDGKFGFHGSHTLFDEADGMVDEGTGESLGSRPGIEADVLAYEGMRTVTPGERHKRQRRAQRLDKAEKWLMENDPNYGK